MKQEFKKSNRDAGWLRNVLKAGLERYFTSAVRENGAYSPTIEGLPLGIKDTIKINDFRGGIKESTSLLNIAPGETFEGRLGGWEERLPESYPNLNKGKFRVIGSGGGREDYNCYAFAIEANEFVDPGAKESKLTLAIVEKFFNKHGYTYDKNAKVEGLIAGKQKIVFYETDGHIKHVAVQTPVGNWISKLGSFPLIQHEKVDQLSNYGTPMYVFTRPNSEFTR